LDYQVRRNAKSVFIHILLCLLFRLHLPLVLLLQKTCQKTGAIELMKKWNEENIVNNKEHDALLKARHIAHDLGYYQV
jgi:hypothetical protein